MARKFMKIVAPTDFSETSREAVRYAMDLVAPGGTILVCHVVDDVQLTYGYVGVAVPPPELDRRVTDEAQRELADFVPAPVPEGVTVEQKVLHGSPYLGIVKMAKDRKADLIVMGTHGRTGLKHMLLGSVAEKVVRRAPCPVLVVHQPDGEFETA